MCATSKHRERTPFTRIHSTIHHKYYSTHTVLSILSKKSSRLSEFCEEFRAAATQNIKHEKPFNTSNCIILQATLPYECHRSGLVPNRYP